MSSTGTTATGEPPKKMQKGGTKVLLRDHFQGPHGRSFPGLPPKERNGRAYFMPFSELTADQRTAAGTLFGIHSEDGDNWESIMPRRSYGCPTTYVLEFQTKIWNQLNEEEQKAARVLGMSQEFWNNQLAPFHDDLWNVPEVSMTRKEFAAVLATIRKMSQKSVLTKKRLAQFLLNLNRLLLPSQGAAIAETLRESPSWESLTGTATVSTKSNKVHVHIVVASFLTDPMRFVDFAHTQLNLFWNDDSHGCVWGNAGGGYGASCRGKRKEPYGKALAEFLASRKVDPILARGVPAPKTSTGSGLPRLPKPVVKYILDEMLGTPDGVVDPFEVSWLYGYDATLTVFFDPR